MTYWDLEGLGFSPRDLNVRIPEDDFIVAGP